MNRHLSNAISLILKPIVGLLFRNGISFGEFSRLAKLAYIDVTEKELKKSGQKTTTSMISITTGLTRKEVAALRKDTTQYLSPNTQQNRAVKVISAWVNEPQFCDIHGQASVLSIQGEGETFEKLVNQHSGDMPYRAMLNELLRTKSVEIRGDDKVALIQAAYIPCGNENGKYDLLGEDVSLLISTIKYNITSEDEEPRFQRKVSYDKIPKEHLEEFKELANRESQRLLIKLNTWLAQHDMDNQTTIASEHPMKVGVGAYYFEEPNKKQKVIEDEN